MIRYATDTSRWEPWQRDYGLGLILIIPPEEVARQIDPLRAKHDPRAFANCPTRASISRDRARSSSALPVRTKARTDSTLAHAVTAARAGDG
ncbi:MAG: hypothetical protein JW889_16645 [Verrucomicrobia bacterium]|nr:hypothetical protein [Verrucomicrobiota bacterium]